MIEVLDKEVEFGRVVLMKALLCAIKLCVVLTFECLDICLCIVLELTPQENEEK